MVTEDFGMNFYQGNCGKMVLDFLSYNHQIGYKRCDSFLMELKLE